MQERKNDNIRDRLVVGLRDSQLSQDLQMKKDLNLETAVEIARQHEQVKTQVTQQHKGQEKSLEEIKKSSQARKFTKMKPQKSKTETQQNGNQTLCGRCNRSHPKGQCPPYKAQCRKCGKRGHFAICCRTRVQKHRQSGNVGEVALDRSSPTSFFLGVVTSPTDKKEDPWLITLPIHGQRTVFKIDCGADVTVVAKSTYDSMRVKPTLISTDHQLSTAAGEKLKCYGIVKVKTKYKGRHYRDTAYVAECNSNLLSRDMCTNMGILTLNIDECNTNQVPDNAIFGEIGKVEGDPVKIQLKENAIPYHVSTARRVALPLMEKVQAELNRMEKLGVIEKVTEPTDWCSPMAVAMKKNGKVRICVDLRQLNRAVKRERYTFPTIQDIASKLEGATIFSSLDAASGYHQLPLAKDSAKLTTFMTPFARYMFMRLPFGISSASEIFQRRMSDMLAGIPGVAVYQDDILVAGSTMQEHDSRLEQVFRAIHKAGLKLNKEKCKFRQETLDYLGHKFSSQGMSPSPDKIKAISEMKAPSDVTELRRYLGMVNYLGGYIPNLSQIEQPLNELLKKESVWTWGEKQRNAFAEIKKLLTTAPTLAYYDPVKPVTVSADASGYGIGAVLLQGTKTDVHPVAYASRTMTQSEQRYAQIEKECLAATWACEKFHRYLFGLEKFRLITDHKPLVPIINSEDLNKVPLRCQRLLMRLMKYNAQAEFAPGKTLQVADTLSRQPLEETESESINSEDIHEVYLQEEVVRTSWPVSDDKLEDIRQETEIDPKLRDAIKLLFKDGPNFVKKFQPT